MNILSKIFGAGAKELVGTVGNVLDDIITSKEERDRAKLAIEGELNRHIEALESNALKEIELQNQDRESARSRETEFVKATGRADRMQIFVGTTIMLAFFTSLVLIGFKEIPTKNEHLMINAIGILEGLVMSVAGYYFSSSLGSRIKDMRK